jgi:dTDP-4-amino-4,6-dideoxygalactose transaminase
VKDYLAILLNFQKYIRGCDIQKLQDWLKSNISSLGSSNEYFLFENARSGLYILLKSLQLPPETEVAVQGFTCNAAVNPILWIKAKPIYIDIDTKTYNMSLKDLKEKYSPQMKVLILQHTFGIPANVEEICDWANQHNIFVIEDCAHSINVQYKGKKIGTFGDGAIYSFGLEKVLSTRTGGVLMINSQSQKHQKILSRVEKEYSRLEYLSWVDTFLWLMNPIIWRFLRVLGPLEMNLAKLLTKVGFLNMGFYKGELYGRKPDKYPRKLSNALASVSLLELTDLDQNIAHRKEITQIYNKKLRKLKDIQTYELNYKSLEKSKKNILQKDDNYKKNNQTSSKEVFPLVRYPIVLPSIERRREIKQKLVKHNIYVGDWYHPVIYPAKTDLDAMQYVKGICPKAEDISERILNLPTGQNITSEKAHKITELLQHV